MDEAAILAALVAKERSKARKLRVRAWILSLQFLLLHRFVCVLPLVSVFSASLSVLELSSRVSWRRKILSVSCAFKRWNS